MKTAPTSCPSFSTGPELLPIDSGKQVGPGWTFADHLGAIGVRLNIRRMRYCVAPGLVAFGVPGPESPVFVSANYKLSFDLLRRALAGMNAWILVLDTNGINVWCAAAKGTFGTAELVHRIRTCRLGKRVTHRRLILPQLSAPGIVAHKVKEQTGFTVVYGPIYAADIPAFVQAGFQATPNMRRIRFGWRDRLGLVPLELVSGFRRMLLVGLILAVLTGFSSQGFSLTEAWEQGGLAFSLWMLSCVIACMLGPLLLPVLPTRAFSIKGAGLGLVLASCGVVVATPDWSVGRTVAWFLIVSVGASHWLLVFTGATPFTSPSGVRREVRLALPAQIVIAGLGLFAWTGAGFLPRW